MYWPGDDIKANTLASDDYQKVTSERMARLREYITSDDFPSKFADVIPIELRSPKLLLFLYTYRDDSINLLR